MRGRRREITENQKDVRRKIGRGRVGGEVERGEVLAMGTALMGKEISRGWRERPTEVGRRGWRAGKIAETGDGSGGGEQRRGEFKRGVCLAPSGVFQVEFVEGGVAGLTTAG